MFGTYWQYNHERSYLPFDIQVAGYNINKITYKIEDGNNVDFYWVISLDMFEGDLIELNDNNKINIQFKMFDQLRESDKLILKDWYHIEAEEIEEYYNNNILEIVKKCLEGL